MTKQQEDQFKDNGCVSRCLLHVRNQRQSPAMSVADYVDTYVLSHPRWKTHCGLLNTGAMADMIKRLGIAHDFQVYRQLETIAEEIQYGRPQFILLFTEKEVTTPGQAPTSFSHCRVVEYTLGTKAPLKAYNIDLQLMKMASPVDVTDELLKSLVGYLCLFF